MNKKGGIFSLLVGAMAIAIMALVVFSGQAAINEEESDSFIEIMGDTRAAYQNVVLVFNAAVQDAVADGAVTAGGLDAYLSPAMSTMNNGFGPIIQCNYTINSFIAGTADITITCEGIIENSTERRFLSNITKTVSFS